MCNTDFSTGFCYTSFHMVTSKMYEVHIMKRVKQIYSERITIQDVLIFVYISLFTETMKIEIQRNTTFPLPCYFKCLRRRMQHMDQWILLKPRNLVPTNKCTFTNTLFIDLFYITKHIK